jgi:hypothetical protein
LEEEMAGKEAKDAKARQPQDVLYQSLEPAGDTRSRPPSSDASEKANRRARAALRDLEKLEEEMAARKVADVPARQPVQTRDLPGPDTSETANPRANAALRDLEKLEEETAARKVTGVQVHQDTPYRSQEKVSDTRSSASNLDASEKPNPRALAARHDREKFEEETAARRATEVQARQSRDVPYQSEERADHTRPRAKRSFLDRVVRMVTNRIIGRIIRMIFNSLLRGGR